MVSKILKKTPTRSIKQGRCFPGKSTLTPVKLASATVPSTTFAATIHDSLFTCRRRLAKIISKLLRIATPTSSSKLRRRPTTPNTKRTISPVRRTRGIRRFKIADLAKPQEDGGNRLNDEETKALISDEEPGTTNNNTSLFASDFKLNNSVQKTLFFGLPPPPPVSSGPKGTVFLDLDETLIHSTAEVPPDRFDFVVTPVINGAPITFYVLKRPGADELLRFLSKRFEVVVFTAGLKEYASLVLDKLDGDREGRMISHRLYRDSCRDIGEGRYAKDLSKMGRDLNKVVIVDDNPTSCVFQPDNAIQIRPFVDDLEDREAWRLIEFFDGCGGFEDFREAIRAFAPYGWQNLE